MDKRHLTALGWVHQRLGNEWMTKTKVTHGLTISITRFCDGDGDSWGTRHTTVTIKSEFEEGDPLLCLTTYRMGGDTKASLQVATANYCVSVECDIKHGLREVRRLAQVVAKRRE